MTGIVSFGSYIPTYRLPRDVIAKEWDSPLGGERDREFDEDSLSMAVNASVDALVIAIHAR
jgi:3-hydroxy-3-methylglutaryl CoA synthase